MYKIDAVTGTAVFVGSAGLPFLPAIAFDGNDVLYGLGVSPTNFQFNLLTINTTTGVPSLIGLAPMGDWRGMAFDPTDGTLWASTNGEEIYVIDPSTGTPTLIGTTGLGVGTPDIDFDDMGNLYGAVGGGRVGSNNFISINKTTGAGTIIGPTGFTSVSGMSVSLNTVVGIEDDSNSPIPTSFALGQNYPNPFNPTTAIQYSLPAKALVTLKIYNILGQEVATLVNKEQDAGSYEVQFDGSSPSSGRLDLSSGVYFYRLQARPTDGGKTGEFVDTKKLILLK